jgi:negative regulator of flagellin synthesis FlgM
MSYQNNISNLQSLLQILNPGNAQKTETAGKTAANGVAPASKDFNADQASVSVSGGALSQALSGSDVRTDKVAALQNTIASGLYQVSPGDVADKLIESLLS